MKRRLESDEADRRISQAALHLARGVTASIEDSATVSIYVNLASPLIDKLLVEEDEKCQRVGRLVRLFSENTMRNSEAGIGVDTEHAYRVFFDELLQLLQE